MPLLQLLQVKWHGRLRGLPLSLGLLRLLLLLLLQGGHRQLGLLLCLLRLLLGEPCSSRRW